VADVMNMNYIVVLGNDGKIKENKDVFKNLENVFN